MRKSVVAMFVGGAAAAAVAVAPTAQADQLGYVINVTTGPGYNFPNAQAALDYGYMLCGRIAAGDSYPAMAEQIKRDFGPDEYKVSYLLSQSAQELCPAQTWQLRQSVGDGYRPAG
ncbi:DUF732 domain-containing protein [[Mycobacterium] wendilense]|uniref:DUF732 domain-containing protein n=1 Tax=[Mycobacterium] wendilense TaxID=3064284 RepID=A0ABM9MAI7_9MYCO|nr:DUF732 domain-containing protein [Mycolicibacterium sp. MU0050]CAJ1580454.1 DUF732 domain-containing protein [Mycolicibacterium sp. MU0050]